MKVTKSRSFICFSYFDLFEHNLQMTQSMANPAYCDNILATFLETCQCFMTMLSLKFMIRFFFILGTRCWFWILIIIINRKYFFLANIIFPPALFRLISFYLPLEPLTDVFSTPLTVGTRTGANGDVRHSARMELRQLSCYVIAAFMTLWFVESTGGCL